MIEVIETLSEMISGRVVVSEEELKRKALRACFKVLGIEMKNFTEEDLNEVVLSFIDTPVSIKAIHYSERISVDGINFYHLHTRRPSRSDFELALSEYTISKAFLDNLMKMMSLTDEFFDGFEREGYFLRLYSSKIKFAVFFTTIHDIREDAETYISHASKFDGELLLILGSERNPLKFIQFFRDYSEKFKRGKVRVLVANVEKGWIDPFIGYPRDPKLLNRFKNPKLAGLLDSLWKEKVSELD
ncbi:MAG: hypothetical protein N3D09_04815 [Archaeoglobaceae archaeon]|nr:hypothetical protein [Archaeoglobaceae archaeon]